MLADYLKSLRLAHGQSLESLAIQAGISRKTLSRWEHGMFQPCIPEIESLLTALQASKAERLRALEMLAMPRGARLLRSEISHIETPDPIGGELLWGLRLRKGWSLEQLATQIGVSNTTVGRWERGESWPNTSTLEQLCHTLGAHTEEYTALISGRYTLCNTGWDLNDRRSVAAYDVRWRELERSCITPEGYALYNLRCLALSAVGMRLLTRYSAVRPSLCRVLWSHSRHLTLAELHPAAERAAERLIRVSEGHSELITDWVFGQVILARARTNGADSIFDLAKLELEKTATRPQLKYGIQLLNSILDAPARAATRAWLHSALARLHARAGNSAAALAIARRGVAIAEEGQDYTAIVVRKVDVAAVQVYAGRACDALANISYDDAYGPETTMHTTLLHVLALTQLGEINSAAMRVTELSNMIETYRYDHLRPHVNRLEQRINDRIGL